MLCESSFPAIWWEKILSLALCDCFELFPLIFSDDCFLGLWQCSYTHTLGDTQLNTQGKRSAATCSLCKVLYSLIFCPTNLATLFSDLNSVSSIQTVYWLPLDFPSCSSVWKFFQGRCWGSDKDHFVSCVSGIVVHELIKAIFLHILSLIQLFQVGSESPVLLLHF